MSCLFSPISGGPASPTSASLSASPTSSTASPSSLQAEHRTRLDRPKAPDRVAFVAASKHGFTRLSGSSTASTATTQPTADAEPDADPRRARLTRLADRMDVDVEVDEERKAGVEERMEGEEGEDVEEEEDDINRYKPISVPFRKQRSSAPTTSASSPYPPRSAASIITKPATDNNNLLFFQLPSHLPLQPNNLPTPAPLTTTTTAATAAASSSTLPAKPPALPTSTASSTSSYLAAKTLIQKRKLLTFDPSFPNSLQYVAPGLVGRLLVWRSGRVQLEVGGVRLDVGRGQDCLFHQQVVSVHAAVAADGVEAAGEAGQGLPASGGGGSGDGGGRREWVELGEVRERLVCTMDVDDLQRKRDSRGSVVIGRTGELSDEKGAGNVVKMKEEKI